MHTWLHQSVNWWNSMVVRRGDDLVRRALADSISMAETGNSVCWGAAFLKAVTNIDPDAANLVHSLYVLPASSLQAQLSTKYYEHSWGDFAHFDAGLADPLRDITDSNGFKEATYRHWFCHSYVGANEPARCPVEQREGFAYHVNHPQQIRTLSTIRMSAHKLNIETMRHFGPQHRARADRLCTCCTANVIEDEMHVLECPEYEALRNKNIFRPAEMPLNDATMLAVMNPTSQDGWKRLAIFLHKVFLARSAKLD
jgi:hypothetical protein